jgi:hypothetical protein
MLKAAAAEAGRSADTAQCQDDTLKPTGRRVMRRLKLFLVVALLAIPTATSAQGLAVDWSDHPRDPEFAADAVFQRNLVCWKSNQRETCQLTVVTIGRNSCPAHLTATSWRTDTGDLKISRTSTAVDLEFDDVSLAGPTHWTLHLKLLPTGRDQFIVDEASGVVVTRPLVPGDRIRSTELIALIKGTKGLDKLREWADVDLKCPRIAVVAAKK